MKRIALPFRGEFGHLCMHHAPQVNALPAPKIAMIEPGNEALYPGCEYEYVLRREDGERRARVEPELLEQAAHTMRVKYGDGAQMVYPSKEAERAHFVPEPTVRGGIACDVVVCPRWRQYGESKNWAAWPDVTRELQERGLRTFAGGSRDASCDVPGPKAWDHDRCLDATIEAMLSAKVVLATDGGLAHLAIMCGRPLVLVSYQDGRTAPGPDGQNRHPYNEIRMQRFHDANHRDAPIRCVHHSWEEPERAVDAVMQAIGGGE